MADRVKINAVSLDSIEFKKTSKKEGEDVIKFVIKGMARSMPNGGILSDEMALELTGVGIDVTAIKQINIEVDPDRQSVLNLELNIDEK